MSKERLEEIKITKYTYLETSKTDLRADFSWLIEQAERVDGLVKVKSKLAEKLHKEREQNKRYRQVLEEIADESYMFAKPNYKEEYEALIEIAHKALESESK